MLLDEGMRATASATFADLRRRHGVLLAVLAIAVLLLLLPDICARAVDDSASLTMQVGLSTIGVFLTLLAGFTGLRCGAAEGDLGASAEWRTAPLAPAKYVLGRFCGIAVLVVLVFVLLAPFLVARQFGDLRVEPPSLQSALFAACGILLAAALFGAIGMFLASAASAQLAAILLVASVVATRTLVPSLATRAPALRWLAAVLPDASRLDFSRELAFQRPLDATATALALAAGALHVAAFLCAAAWCLRRREA